MNMDTRVMSGMIYEYGIRVMSGMVYEHGDKGYVRNDF